MAIVMSMRWPGVTPAQYDAVREAVGWEVDEPQGGIHHVAWFDDDGLRVVDVWASAADFDRFTNDRLMPGVQQVGIESQPEVEIKDAHAVFAPGQQ